MNERVEHMFRYALMYLGTHYKFGGRNILEGLDCSQFVTEMMISCGLLPHGSDFGAQGLFDFFVEPNKASMLPQPGALSFYGKNADNIAHVGLCISDLFMYEAGGGDHTTISFQDAIDRNAFVRQRPIKYRKDYFCCLMPNYDKYI